MQAVDQTKLMTPDGIHNGNCFGACLASLLSIPLWMVPPFEDMFGRGRGEWVERVDEWLARMFDAKLVRTEGHNESALPEFYIANGLSARMVRHSVIYSRGSLVHDPHPSRTGIYAVEWTWHIERKAA